MAESAGVRLLHDARASIGESPAWRDGRVWWPDPVGMKLLIGDAAGFASIPTARPVWSLALAPGGQMIGSLDDRLARVADDGSLETGPAASVALGCRFNDMTAGPDGVLWVGSMHRGVLATRGAIFRAASIDATPVLVAEGLGVPNGIKLSADGGRLFVVDTLQRTLLAYPVAGDGLGEPAIVTDFLGLPGKPDGMIVAPDGSFWVAMWGGGSVVQIAPDGAPLREIAVPALHVSSLCLAPGGRLLVSTSRMRLSPRMLENHPQSGGLFEIRLEDDV